MPNGRHPTPRKAHQPLIGFTRVGQAVLVSVALTTVPMAQAQPPDATVQTAAQRLITGEDSFYWCGYIGSRVVAIESLQIVTRAPFNGGAGYWPIRVRASGRCDSALGSPTRFTTIGGIGLRQNDFQEWFAVPLGQPTVEQKAEIPRPAIQLTVENRDCNAQDVFVASAHLGTIAPNRAATFQINRPTGTYSLKICPVGTPPYACPAGNVTLSSLQASLAIPRGSTCPNSSPAQSASPGARTPVAPTSPDPAFALSVSRVDPSGVVITSGGFAGLKTGHNIQDAETFFQRQMIQEPLCEPSARWATYTPRGLSGVLILTDNGRIAAFDVSANLYSTRSGLKVGDSEARVTALYGADASLEKRTQFDESSQRSITEYFLGKQSPTSMRILIEKGRVSGILFGSSRVIGNLRTPC